MSHDRLSPHEQAGDQVRRLVRIMDQLRSPGGCPWDAQQTHSSLAEYLLEETYETLSAIDDGSRADLIEELGDLLLQVVFHARLGEESDPAWSLDDVARGISDKLVRRHPHVFESAHPAQPGDLAESWSRAKAREKGRSSALDGIPTAMPALAQAQKTWRRARELGIPMTSPAAVDRLTPEAIDETSLSAGLLALVVAAEESGLDAEGAMRRGIAQMRQEIRDQESESTPAVRDGTAEG